MVIVIIYFFREASRDVIDAGEFRSHTKVWLLVFQRNLQQSGSFVHPNSMGKASTVQSN